MKKRWNWKRIPVFFLTLLVTAQLLTLGGPAGTARGSPSEEPEAAESREPLKDAPGRAEKAEILQKLLMDAQIDRPPAEAVPVPESSPVTDTYFDDVVFLGDSRTEGFYLYSGLKTGKFLYAVGATVESVFSKKAWDSGHGKIPLLDALAETEYEKVYLMLGINELGWSKAENYRDQYTKLIDRVREDHPEAVVVLQSILPVSAKQDAKGSYVNNKKIIAYNEIIADLASEKGCVFLDSAEAVAGPDGCLPAEWTFDGVHLNPAGCRILLDYYRTHSVTAS
ncbi:MAG: hypothetical protein HFG08_11340 [Oscillibacter sp.]|nr:hypothetical protein [Oscillibacter sp.]